MNNPAITKIDCFQVRNCSNNKCIFRMMFNGLKLNPRTDLERKKNADIERQNGKGLYPNLYVSQGNGETIDLLCKDFKEKK